MSKITMTRSIFLSMLEKTIKNPSLDKNLPIDIKLLQKYCELTGHDFEFYKSRNLIPLGFLMTLTTKLFTELFVLFFSRHRSVIKGVVHSSSKIELYRPFLLNAEYRGTLAIKNIVEKIGKKGKFFVVDIEVCLWDQNNLKIIADRHQFFIKYNKVVKIQKFNLFKLVYLIYVGFVDLTSFQNRRNHSLSRLICIQDHIKMDRNLYSQYNHLISELNPLHLYKAYARYLGYQNIVVAGIYTFSFLPQTIEKLIDAGTGKITNINVVYKNPIYINTTIVQTMIKKKQENKNYIEYEILVHDMDKNLLTQAMIRHAV